jgi:hypothetical protein
MTNHLLYRVFAAAMGLGLGMFAHGLWVRAQGQGEVVKLGTLKSSVPTDWTEEKPDDPSCYKRYRLEAVGDDKENASLTIHSPAKEERTSAARQVEHWKALFLPPEGKKLDDVAKVRESKVSGAAVTYLDVRGDYKGIPGDPLTPRGNYRLLAVYFPTSAGPYLIRLLGPADTVEFYRKGFEDWVKAFK